MSVQRIINMSNTANSYPLFKLPDEVHETLTYLRGNGFYAYLVGGALRDTLLGCEPKDWDIFCITSNPDETFKLHRNLVTKGFEQQHQASYDSEGYLADYRKGNVNVVVYSDCLYTGIAPLVQGFDMNMNMWLYDDLEEMIVYNVADWDTTKPVEIHNRSKSHRVHARVTKFKERYPNLDWSKV